MDNRFEHVQNEAVQLPAKARNWPGHEYRIYRVRVNGESLGAVKEDKLRDLLIMIKGLDLYRDTCSLTHGQTFETDIRVHGESVHVWVQVHVWKVLSGEAV